MDYPGKVIFVLGVSGAGKNTVITELMKRDLGLTKLISCKTRPLRPEEKQDVDYHYMTIEEFQRAVDDWELLEHAYYASNWYGTRKKDLVDLLLEGKNVIKELEIQGLMSIAKDNPDIRKATRSIFLDIDNETMRRRIENRAKLTGTIVPEEEIARRISAAENERKLAQEYCTVIVNGTGTIEEETDRAEKIIIQFLEKSHINPISQST